MIPYLNMNARITIGKAVFTEINSFKIEESVVDIGNKATLIIPRNYKSLRGKPVLDVIKAGDAVTIEAGYNGKYYVEFEGFVRNIDAEMPIKIDCDDKFYPLKQNNWVKAYKSVTLKALLQEIITGYKVDCPDVNLGKFEIDNASSYEVLRKIQQEYGLFSRIAGDTLIVGFSWDFQASTRNHIYEREKNVRASALEWKRQEDFKLRVRVEFFGDKKKKKHVEVGFAKKGNVKTIQFSGNSEAEAKKLADSVYNKFAYNGFSGSITGFGTPRTHAGDSLDYKEVLNPEKNGRYLIQKVAISYGPNGYSRQNTIAYKL